MTSPVADRRAARLPHPIGRMRWRRGMSDVRFHRDARQHRPPADVQTSPRATCSAAAVKLSASQSATGHVLLDEPIRVLSQAVRVHAKGQCVTRSLFSERKRVHSARKAALRARERASRARFSASRSA